jgi:hypothetical protein
MEGSSGHHFPGLKPRATKNEVPLGLSSVGNSLDISGRFLSHHIRWKCRTHRTKPFQGWW